MNKVLVLGRIQKTIGIALAISYLLAVFAIVRAQILPVSYLAIIIPVTGIVIAYLVFIISRKHSQHLKASR